jgi:hypothetical protein
MKSGRVLLGLLPALVTAGLIIAVRHRLGPGRGIRPNFPPIFLP